MVTGELVPGIVPVHTSLLVSNKANICQEKHENIVIEVPKKNRKKLTILSRALDIIAIYAIK